MNDIHQKLISFGMDQEQASQAVKDVGEIVSKKVLNFYFTKLSPEEMSKIEALAQEDIPKYLTENKSRLPELTKEEVEGITIKTWEDFFSNVSN